MAVDNYAVIHDKRREAREDFRDHFQERLSDKDLSTPNPRVHSLPDGHVVVWLPKKLYFLTAEISAWNRETVVQGRWFHPPFLPGTSEFYRDVAKRTVLEGGDYFAFTTGAGLEGQYGHYKHDVLPVIAYFRATLPATTKFLLLDVGVNRETLEFIDPKFVAERVHWIQFDEEIIVRGGTLSVSVTNVIPYYKVHDHFNYLREWIQMNHPPLERQKRNRVIYYKRLIGDAAVHGTMPRVLDLEQEAELLRRVQKAKIRNRLTNLELVVFDGVDPLTNQTMSLRKQFELFRSARTIIGPHGTGLGGNLVWTNPSPRSCFDRVELLEFIPGKDSSHVHGLYASHYPFYRGMPINYHVALYLNESTKFRTLVDLDMVDEFLDNVWAPVPSRQSATTK